MKRSRGWHILAVIGLMACMVLFTPVVSGFQADTGQKTSEDQKNNKADVDLTARIRKEIVVEKSLSTSAHNITLKSEDGAVILRGSVNSSAEKDTVLEIARRIAGASHVTDQVTVTPANQ